MLAVLAGVLWAFAFPRFNFALAAWLVPGLMLLLGVGVSAKRAAVLGYLAGLSHHLIALSWLLNIPFPIGNIAAWLSLSAYCALYPAAWMWLCHRLRQRISPCTVAGEGARFVGSMPIPGTQPLKFGGTTWQALNGLLAAPWLNRQLWLLFGASAWTGAEFLRGWFLSGFPWNFLAASQYELLPLIQLASVTGVHGISFVVVWMSLTLAAGAAFVLVRPHARFAWKNEIALSLVVLLLLIVWGVGRTTKPSRSSARTLRAALVQPSIPQTLIFDPAENTNRFRQLLELTREVVATAPDLLIWPEAALPAISREQFEELRTLLQEHRMPFIFGAGDAEPRPGGDGGQWIHFNAALHFDAGGSRRQSYRKQRLVIFGEYTPLARQLPFLADWLPAGEGFGTGEGPVTFRIEPADANIPVNICFEDNFADIVRAQVGPETDFVLNLTNNGWFGESAAQWQHAANAVFRAVECGVPLVRCTNNGLTCWIDERGRIRQIFTDARGSVYGSGTVVFGLPLREVDVPRRMTIYHRYGDWFGWLCLAITLAGAFAALVRRPSQAVP